MKGIPSSRGACVPSPDFFSLEMADFYVSWKTFLTDRTIGRAFGTACRLSVCLSSVTFCTHGQNGRTDLHEIFREGVD